MYEDKTDEKIVSQKKPILPQPGLLYVSHLNLQYIFQVSDET